MYVGGWHLLAVCSLCPTSSFWYACQVIQEVLPKAGLVYSEKGNLSEVLCKPKIMPIKSVTLERLEQLEKEAALTAAADNQEESKQ